MFSVFQFVLSRFFGIFLRVTSTGSFPPPLAEKEERALFEKARKGDLTARGSLIEHNLRLVAHIVKKYYASARDPEDLVSIGTIGLIKAIDTFDPHVGARFATYAGKCVQNEILMHFRAAKKLSGEISLSDAIEYDRDGNPLTYLDVAGEEEDVCESLHHRMRQDAAREAVERVLFGRERQIVILRYGLLRQEPMTQRAVAQKLGISRSYVSRLEKGALEKIRVYLAQRNVFSES